MDGEYLIRYSPFIKMILWLRSVVYVIRLCSCVITELQYFFRWVCHVYCNTLFVNQLENLCSKEYRWFAYCLIPRTTSPCTAAYFLTLITKSLCVSSFLIKLRGNMLITTLHITASDLDKTFVTPTIGQFWPGLFIQSEIGLYQLNLTGIGVL